MIYLGLGANLPGIDGRSPLQTLEAAIALLQELQLEIVARSSFWECEPVPPSDQPWFVNGVIEIKTEMGPHELMAHLLSIEQVLGRERREKWAARVIDLDLLAYENLLLDAKDNQGRSLRLPHPRLHERRFVLAPLAEIAPNWLHPALETNARQMLAALDESGEARKIAL